MAKKKLATKPPAGKSKPATFQSLVNSYQEERREKMKEMKR
jgi:hypothetical protein